MARSLPALVFGLLAAAPFLGLGEGWAMTLLARGMILALAALSLWLPVGGAGLGADLVDSAVLLASEVVTNAFTHGRSEARMCGVADARHVRVEVSDDNSRHPRRTQLDPDALDGRGLALIDSLAWRWGVRDDRFGKTVWFEVRG